MQQFILCFTCLVLNGRVSGHLPHLGYWDPCPLRDLHAGCNIRPNMGRSAITGMAILSQFVREQFISIKNRESCTMGHLNVDLFVKNVPKRYGMLTSKHGLHVHTSGDTLRGCDSMGPHFNPYKSPHGAPWMPPSHRHVGDFGNVVRRADGTIRARFGDYLATLYGPNSIIGRGLVLHEGIDDLGLGGVRDSLRTGNAGQRLACCVITV